MEDLLYWQHSVLRTVRRAGFPNLVIHWLPRRSVIEQTLILFGPTFLSDGEERQRYKDDDLLELNVVRATYLISVGMSGPLVRYVAVRPQVDVELLERRLRPLARLRDQLARPIVT